MFDLVDYTLKIFSDCYIPLAGHNDEYTNKFIVSLEKSIDESDEDTERVGYLSCSVVNCIDAIDDGEDLREVFDSQSSDYLSIFNALFTKSGDLRESIQNDFVTEIDRLFILDRLALRPSERGNKLGFYMVNKATEILGCGCELMVCIPGSFGDDLINGTPQPADWQKSSHTRKTLQVYYNRIGFQQIGKTLVFARP